MQIMRPFNWKIREGAAGRRNSARKAREWRTHHPGKLAVIHSASAGEFEAALPIIEELKRRGFVTVATLFSPSGYRMAAKSNIPDGVFYLPFDTYLEVHLFLKALEPSVFLFCKHDIWPNVIWNCRDLNIPLLMANANMHKKSFRLNPLFRNFNKGLFESFETIFTVSREHAARIAKITGARDKIKPIGDSRFDRVVARAKSGEMTLPSDFIDKPVFIAGSVWMTELFVLESFLELKKSYPQWRLIWTPHEPSESCIQKAEFLLEQTGVSSIRFTRLSNYSNQDAIIVDKVGVLPPLYRAAEIAYIGGGFGKGVHSVIEPAAFAIPVIFGPNHHVSAEAGELLKRGGGFSVNGIDDFPPLLKRMFQDENFRSQSGKIAGNMVAEKVGASILIANRVEEILILQTS